MPVDLTLGMRILLHLSAYEAGAGAYDIPPQLTQQGIAEALSVRQSDVSRALARLKAEGLVEERSSTVGPGRAGRKQRLKVYNLSQSGRQGAASLSARVLETEVTLNPPGAGEAPRRLPLKEVNPLLGTSYPVLRLADMVAPDGTFGPPPAAAERPAAPEPAPEPFFVGRERELGELGEWISHGPESVLSVVGIPGAGKTSLARRLLAQLRDRPAFYFQVREWPSYGGLLKALRDFLARSGRRRLAGLTVRAAPPPVEEAASALSRDLAGLSALIVLDDFHHASGQPELGHFVMQLAELLPSVVPPSRLLLFSCRAPNFYGRRDRALDSTVRELQLGGLDEPCALELARRSGVPQTALHSVYSATRGHPLSIRLLGMPPGSPAQAAGALQFIQEDVIGRIPPGERALLQLTSALRRPAPQETLLALSDDPLAYDALSALVSRSLVSNDEGRYEVHEMVREGAYGRLPTQARKAVHMRAAALFLKNSDPGSGAEAVYHLCRAGELERASQLLLSLGGELISEGRLEECRFLLDMVDPGPPSATEGLRRLRQDLLAEYGEWDVGYEHLQQCLLLARITKAGARAPGLRMRSEKEWRAALAEHKRGLEVLRRVGDTPGQCELLTSLGWIHLMRGEHREASAAYRQAGRHCGSGACRQASLRAGLGLGQAAMLGGDRAMAARRFRQVLRRLRMAETGMSIAALNHLALLAEDESELRKALDHLGAALSACGTGRHRRERAYTLLHRGQVRSRLGEHEAAVKDISSALEEFGGIGDPYGTMYALLALAAEAIRAGELAEAGRWTDEALRQRSMIQLAEAREQAARLAAMISKEKARSRSRQGAASGEGKAGGGT